MSWLNAAWQKTKALCLGSATVAVQYFFIAAGLADEAKLLDWSTLVGAEHAGRVVAVLGVISLLARLRSLVASKA